MHANVTTALLALHFQNDILDEHGKVRVGFVAGDRGRERFIDQAARLLNGARGCGIAVISVRIAFPDGYIGVVQNAPIFRDVARSGALAEGSWGAEFHEQLSPKDGEAVVSHTRVNAFFDSDLDHVLQQLGVRRVLVAGVATHSTVEHSARHATDLGYDVTIVADACASADPELHAASLRSLAPHVDRIATVDELLADLGSDVAA
ncbi:MAG TPA: cysteine hydrolase [Vicinamibacterales bacterium]